MTTLQVGARFDLSSAILIKVRPLGYDLAEGKIVVLKVKPYSTLKVKPQLLALMLCKMPRPKNMLTKLLPP